MESVRIKQNNEALYHAANLLNVINGRPELLAELMDSPKNVILFISSYFKKLIEDPKWLDAIKAIARHERARNVVLSTIEKIIALEH